jgi:hypothetical protein
MPAGALAHQQIVANELVSCPITPDTLPTMVKIFTGSLVVLQRGMLVAAIDREFG